MISAETLPGMMIDTAKSYTDSQISQLEQRLTEKLAGSEARIVAQVDERLKQHRSELDGIESNIKAALEGVSSNIGEMKLSMVDWRVRTEALNSIDMELREVQAKQLSHTESLKTLQSDMYGQPSRGRETIFGLISGLTTAVETLSGKVDASSLWIEAETVRQAEARQRWKNREQAALALAKAIPIKAITAAVGIGGTALFVFLKAIGG